ncbi:hypothetical protein KJS93_13285 [Flavihumibacter fluvii]|nr:hypothetical protein KJS93_13285 [Flavihumibacter fluvii]
MAEIDENWSPYVFAYNKPISYNDLYGLSPDSTAKPNRDEVKLMGEVVVTAKKKYC